MSDPREALTRIRTRAERDTVLTGNSEVLLLEDIQKRGHSTLALVAFAEAVLDLADTLRENEIGGVLRILAHEHLGDDR